ncbi:DUF2865 domain-containing protein [Methylocystis parvus]|uniref:DUF2865 domain-containing protein n=1 Tax=Methylocystis parvus TaxID=134 RepID=UPI003C728A94
MSMSPAPASGRSSRAASARSAISLGAAFALFCAVFTGYDVRASRAAGGLIDAVFGAGAPPAQLYYNGYVPHYRSVFIRDDAPRGWRAKRARGHYAQARRQLVERKKFALNRRAAIDPRRSGAVEPVSLNLNVTYKATAANLTYKASNATYRSSASTARAPAPTAKLSGGASRRAVCVRACDGYYFPALPVSRDSDRAAQQASCEKLCPGAEATLFVFPEGSDKIEETKAKSGETYAELLARLDLNDARAKSCSCQTEATAAAATHALLSDSTLRPGDSVVTSQGVRVVKRGSRYPYKETDFLSLAESENVPLSQKSALYAIEKALKTPQGRLAVMNGDHRRHGHSKTAL